MTVKKTKGLGEGEGIKERGLYGRAEQWWVQSALSEPAEGSVWVVRIFLHDHPHGREANCQLYTCHRSGWLFVSLYVALQFDASPNPRYHLTFFEIIAILIPWCQYQFQSNTSSNIFVASMSFAATSSAQCCFILIDLHEMEPHFRLLSLEHKQKFASNFRSWHTQMITGSVH